MGLVEHSKLELQMAGYFDEDSDYGGAIGDAVMELIEVFAKQGHSGMSAAMVNGLFTKLANYEPLLPITGKDEEWGEIRDYGSDPHCQNKRESGLFKNSDGSVHYINAIVKRTPDGLTWTGSFYLTREDAIDNKNRIGSKLEIKGFPFTPKTFYIDVLEEEIEKDNWISWCKDPSQLDEVWEYYKKPY